MPYFKDEPEVYAFIGRLFEEMARDEALAPSLRRANTIVQFALTEPDSSITVRLVPEEDIVVDLGETGLDPEVVMTMHTDIAHRFWLGLVNVTVALARGDMEAKGPVAKIIRLVPLVEPVFPRYEQMLADAGRDDLLEPVRQAPAGESPAG